MDKTQHPSNNFVLGAPKDWDQATMPCGALPVTRVDWGGHPAVVSYWTPTADELLALAAGAKVALWVIGQTMPPVAVEVER